MGTDSRQQDAVTLTYKPPTERTPLLSGSTDPEDEITYPTPTSLSRSSSSCDEENLNKAGPPSPTEAPPKPFKAPATAIVLVLTIGVFIAQLDSSFVLATHTHIASEFGRLASSSWIVLSYSLAMCAVQPCYGKLSDVFGRKQALMIAYTLFAVGSLVCGVARTMGGVIFGRAVAGAGGAGVGTLVSLIIVDLVPMREVASLRSYVNIAATTGRSLGGPIGGFLSDSIGWRWSFAAQCPLLLAAGLIAYPLVPRHLEGKKTTLLEKLRRIDFAGAGFLAFGITSAMLVLELAGQKTPWSDPTMVGLLVSSIASGALFLVTEIYWANEPIFPLKLLMQRNVIFVYLLTGLQTAAQFSLMFCVPLYFEVIDSASSAVAGAHLMPAVVGNALGALLTGWIIRRTGRYKIMAIIAEISASLCYTLLIIRWRGNTTFWESLYIFPGGFGTGIAEAAVFISLGASVDKSSQAIVLAGLFQAVNVGGIVGMAGVNAVQRLTCENELERKLAGYPDKAKIISKAVSDISYVMKLTGKLHAIVVYCYVKSLEYTHAVSLACSLLALVFALSIKQHVL